MRSFLLAAGLGLGAGILLTAAPADAQYRYTDDKGVSQVTQYKLHVPAPYRDSAVWIGPRGVGYPALSEEQRKIREREEAYRRIGISTERLMPVKHGRGR